MNWRALQAGFIGGSILASYSMETGATGFKSLTDCIAAGILFGALVEALWTVLKLQMKMDLERH